MARIFINYRREDSITAANIIHGNLLKNEQNKIFIDKKGIPVGFDFKSYIAKKIKKYDIMLAIIGNQWLTLKDVNNELRILNYDDILRMELAEGFKNKKMLIIPVLIDNTKMPDKDFLPDDIKELSFLNAIQFKSDDIENSIEKIEKEITRSIFILNNGEDNIETLTSKDLSSFVEIIDLRDEKCVVNAVITALQANLVADKNILAILDVEDLDKKNKKVDGLKNGIGSYFETAIFSAEWHGIKVVKWANTENKQIMQHSQENIRLRSYRLNTLPEMIKHLNANRPLLAGVIVYDDIWTNSKVIKNGFVTGMPPKKYSSYGGHAIVITQIDLINNKIKFANSWGKTWGNFGFGYFTKEFFEAYLIEKKVWAIEALI